MSRKSSSKKQAVEAAASWYHCEVCDAHITSKERESHAAVCPIGSGATARANGEALEYIRNGVLYTASVQRCPFNVEELKEMPKKYVNNLLFMSEGAMRLTSLHIGQRVLISAADSAAALVRSLWPVPERFLTTIFVSEEDFSLNWSSLKGQVLKVQALPSDSCEVAKSVLLELQSASESECDEEPLSSTQIREIASFLKLELKQLIFAKGSIIRTRFLNKSLEFKVFDWQSDLSDDEPFEKAFQKLSLEINNYKVFKVVAATSFKIVLRNEKESIYPDLTDQVTNCLITKEDVGGLTPQIQQIEETMSFALGIRTLPKGVKNSRGLLVYGASGCGKSMICEVMCNTALQLFSSGTLKIHIIKLNTSELFSKFLGETEKNLATYFDRVYANYPEPTLMIIEDVHNLCPKYEMSEVVKRVAVAFLNLLDEISNRREAQRCFLLATTSHIDALNPSVRRCGRFDCEVEVSAPSPKGRAEILHCLLRKIEDHTLSSADIDVVAQVTHGFVGADLANLVYSASLLALKVHPQDKNLTMQDIDAALISVKPSAMREVLIENPNVHWTDIGGQAELKLKLEQAIEWPLLHAEQFQRLGIKAPRGILMYGPPGCSKTMVAKALATESRLNFLSIKGPELFSMWVGESERAVREVFRKARQVAPAIVFFDEIDAISSERAEGAAGGSGSSVKERVLTQLLTELDGVEALHNVTIVAATNRPDMIDKALLRPGRIDRMIYVGLPDTQARHEIFQIKLKQMPLADDVCLNELVQRTEGYSGAEIQAVCQEAALKTLEEDFDSPHVSWRHFEYALQTIQPRTNPDLLRLYEEYAKKS